MKFIILALVFISQLSLANEVQVIVDPKEPILGESFNVVFKVVTKNGTDPIINFNPQGIEVISRNETGISTRTSYVNGHLSVERSISITYEMIPNRAGRAYLRDINIELNGNTIKHKTVTINVLKAPRRAKNILAMAIVDKDSAYVGESILVRYYLYNKIQVNTTDIKRFPKLDKFLKRYHQEKMRAERVRYNGEIYTRRVIYTAQLFAEKPGTYKIDPITLNVQYMQRSPGYNSLGFGFGKARSKTVTSQAISFEVKPLPAENVPPHFTGLVGDHTFRLEMSKKKYLVNEPIEMKLTVVGNGALELYESPEILKNNEVEKFDANSDLVVGSDFTATKSFNITYLGREPFKTESQSIPLAYFDPQQQKYITVNLKLDSITVAGGASKARSNGNNVEDPTPPVSSFPKVVIPKKDLTPVYKFKNSYLYNKTYILLTLGFILLISLLYKSVQWYLSVISKRPELLKLIEKEGVDYGSLHKLISAIGQGTDMVQIVERSNLTGPTKQYLMDLIKKCEADYKESGKTKSYKVKKKILVEVVENLNKSYETS